MDEFPVKMVIFHSYVNVYQRVNMASGMTPWKCREILGKPSTKQQKPIKLCPEAGKYIYT